MSDQPSSPATPEEAQTSAWSPPAAPSEADSENQLAERPEIKIGGAFVGGFALALLLRRLAG